VVFSSRGSKAKRFAGGPISVVRMMPLDLTAMFSNQVSLDANWKTVLTLSSAATWRPAVRDSTRLVKMDGRIPVIGKLKSECQNKVVKE
jgi:hypothetical protein